MNQLEQNIVNSFRLAKSDIIQLQTEVIKLGENQKKIIEKIEEIRLREVQLYNLYHKLTERKNVVVRKTNTPKTRVITKTVFKRARKMFIASKTGNKFHIIKCPFAKNIKPRTKVHFHSKDAALNKGFKPCKCIA